MFFDQKNILANIDSINADLEGFKGMRLKNIRFKRKGNTFLLVFSRNEGEKTVCTLNLFNCCLLNEDGIHGLPVTEIYIKKPGVFIYEYCNRHLEDVESFFELDIFVERQTEDNRNFASLTLGFEGVSIKTGINNTSEFWELE